MSNNIYRKIIVKSIETDYSYSEITDFRTIDNVIWEHKQRDFDIEYLDFQEVILSPKEMTLELLKN